jgi:hypothetical protein
MSANGTRVYRHSDAIKPIKPTKRGVIPFANATHSPAPLSTARLAASFSSVA